jgi:putative ABC transport system substrate-binding protein
MRNYLFIGWQRIALQVFILILVLLPGVNQTAHAAQAPFRIYMISWRGLTDVERGFQNYLAEHKVPVEYIMRDADKNPALLPQFVEEIKRLKPDLIYTYGTPATLGIVGRYNDPHPEKYIRDIPLAFALVADPVGVNIVPDLSSSKRNVTGVYHIASTEAIIAAITAYRPFTRLGILYNKTEQNMVVYVKSLRETASKQGIKLIERHFKIGADGKPTPEGVADILQDIKKNGAEWLLIGPDSYFGSILDIMGPAVREAKLPAFSAVEAAVMAPEGILAGLVCKYYSIGQFTGYKAEQILMGKKAPAAIPVETLKRFSYVVRIGVAKEFHFYPPVSMFNYAELL